MQAKRAKSETPADFADSKGLASTSSSESKEWLAGVYTLSGVVENHTGMETIGKLREGLTVEDLQLLMQCFESHECANAGVSQDYQIECRLIDLSACSGAGPPAHVLLVKNGLAALGVSDTPADFADALWHEMKALGEEGVDRQFFNSRRGVVQNKRARWNYNVADRSQQADIEAGKGTVYTFTQLPELCKLREAITRLGTQSKSSKSAGESYISEKLKDLFAEANIYYSADTGIGFHGDSERQVVIGANLGLKRVIEWQCFKDALPVGERVTVELEHGDLYFMDVAATGHTWKANSYRSEHFRHRAGFEKWLKRDEAQNQRKWKARRANK